MIRRASPDKRWLSSVLILPADRITCAHRVRYNIGGIVDYWPVVWTIRRPCDNVIVLGLWTGGLTLNRDESVTVVQCSSDQRFHVETD